MSIDWAAFTPPSALIGGTLIGVASVAFALTLWRIAGISGIVGGLLRLHRTQALIVPREMLAPD